MTQPAPAAHAAPEPVDPLLELLAACVVRIERDGRFSGTGFLVATGEVLTCAHVVHGGLPLTVTLADGTTHAAQPSTPLLAPDDPAARFYPYPDAALLRLDALPDRHPCVRLDATPPAAGDRFQLCGFTEGEHAQHVVVRSGAALRVETLLVEDGHTLVKFREGQVIGGFSGGPLLNRRTGGVAAIVESTRSPITALGGFGVPIADLSATIDPDLLARNTAAAAEDGRWERAVEAQAAAEADRARQRDLLPLLDAVVPLELGEDVAPSELLRPRHAVVPFVPRGDLLDQVMRWREADTRLSVLVLAGGGGFGKTRTALEICRHAEHAGWTAGPIDADEAGVDGLNQLTTWPGRLLIAVDYAETRPDLVTALLRRLRRRRVPAACRVVLVVRQRADRQTLSDLIATGDAADDIAALMRRAEWVGLGVGEHELDRRALFDTALTAFTITRKDQPTASPDLYAQHFARPLFVLAAALLAARDPDLDVAGLSENQLLGQILDRHEARYWQRADTRLGLGLHPDDQRTAVALMATVGLWADTADTALVHLVPALADATAERVALVVRWLRSLYGTGGMLEPDLLGEVLVAHILTDQPDLAAAVLATTEHDQLVRALLVLSRVAYRSELARVAVRDALDPRLPDLAADAHHAAPDLVAVLILAVAATQPVRGAAQAQYRIQPLTVLAGQLAVTLGHIAVNGFRELLGTNGDALQPLLAHSLTLVAIHLLETGRPSEGLAPIQEAIRHYRQLADAEPKRHVPSLAAALNNQCNIHTQSGNVDSGLASIDEAIAYYRRLVDIDSSRYLPDLANALNNQSSTYALAGRPREGLSPIDEAIGHYRTLANADADRFMPILATALMNNQLRSH
jgi:tetratricopeptide (TPR) repeat protein